MERRRSRTDGVRASGAGATGGTYSSW
uniref:Uncharacterized protein n=1 Tax=Arundo donax TaxID=35708 RepID=A0A0A9ELA3_ARUDO